MEIDEEERTEDNEYHQQCQMRVTAVKYVKEKVNGEDEEELQHEVGDEPDASPKEQVKMDQEQRALEVKIEKNHQQA